MMMPHKNADVIIKWAQGYDVECQSPTTFEWIAAPNINDLDKDQNYLVPNPLHPDYDYMHWRVKT